MAGTKGSAESNVETVLTGEELILGVDNPSVTPISATWTADTQSKRTFVTRNGKISVSVATSDLTVAIKGTDGNDPSATNPVYVRIGDTEHVLTAALSVTAADATNWCNAGAEEFATNEVGFFAYLGYNATDGVVIGFSRIPWATRYDDFSATTTNEKFCKISDISTAGASDAYENIGYFHAILSAGAGYTWTLPGTTVTISKPVYSTKTLTWVPQWTNLSVGDGTLTATYQIIDRRMFSVVSVTFGSTSSISGSVSFTNPFTRIQTNIVILGNVLLVDTGTANFIGVARYIDPTTSRLFTINAAGTYTSIVELSSTVPHTWATTDLISFEYQYSIG